MILCYSGNILTVQIKGHIMNIFEKIIEIEKNAHAVLNSVNASSSDIFTAKKTLDNVNYLLVQLRNSEVPGNENYKLFGAGMSVLKGEKVIRKAVKICTAFASYYKTSSKHFPDDIIKFAEWNDRAEFIEAIAVPLLSVDAHIFLAKMIMDNLNLWEKEKFSAMAAVMSYALDKRSDVDALIFMQNFDKVYES